MDLLERVRATGLLGERPVVVMLSGGRDSVALLDCAARLAPQVRALHVDYGLRPTADDDEALCRGLCERLGVELRVVRAGAAPATGNLQAWAREVRYEAAREAAGDGGDVAAGHTASDQVETVLYRLAASPGRHALLGMREREGDVVRPLLGVTREETAAHCAARGLEWAEDPSNDDPRFARNRIRHDLLGALGAIHPAAEANVLRTLELLREEAEVLDALADADRLRDLPPALQRIALRRLAGRPVDPEAVLGLEHGSLDVGGGVRAVSEHGALRFADGPPPHPPAAVRLPVPGTVRYGDGRVEAGAATAEIADGTLDRDALGDEVLVRPWRDGDRMRPLGLGGTKSLQDLFTDRKVPRESRRTLPVVVARDEIAWIPGVATGERFRVTAATRERVRLRWSA